MRLLLVYVAVLGFFTSHVASNLERNGLQLKDHEPQDRYWTDDSFHMNTINM